MNRKSTKSNDQFRDQRSVHKRVAKIKQRQSEKISLDSGRSSTQSLRSQDNQNRK